MNVVVTGGGTIAPIDDVRHIANASTGRFSAAITEACLARGAQVWHIHTPNAVLPFSQQAQLKLQALDTDDELTRLAEVLKAWKSVQHRLHLEPLDEGTISDYTTRLHTILHNHPIDVAFLAMAASDFEPTVPFTGKLETPTGEILIPCRPTQKVILHVRDWAPNVYLVGFKLLSRSSRQDLIAAAEAACEANRADATVANDLQTLRQGAHTIYLVRPGHPAEMLAPPLPIADRLVDRVFTWVKERGEL
ncbi:MAG TPA: phosphopantothenoylcysteine decarboxylase [Isosphaeraceae bacterium]|jgi:phosphopantothenate-cysteine ligase|nr:phosphopantothenoylcysteine decarboxylase [Isosphaeraceae bacterium]